jgi:Flp pilus assembly protein TadG
MPRKKAPGEAGQATVELALVLPLLALLLLIVVDFGRVFSVRIALANAAREGARYCALHPGDTAGTRARVRGELGGQVTTDESVTTCPAVTSGQPATVTVQATFAPLTPVITNLTGGAITLQAPATMVVQ